LDGKSAKIDIYSDPRDANPEFKNCKDNTDIICKDFVDAVEKDIYGWQWECPNGEKCKYRHALPKNYILNRDKLPELLLPGEDDDGKTIEEIIEEERAALPSEGLTPVTLETFLAWKKKKE